MGEPKGYRVKKPGETLSEYVKRRMAEEGPMTDEQEAAAFIDGNRLREGAAVVMTSGTGKTKAPMPIIDRTAEDQDAGGGSSSGLVKPRTGPTASHEAQ